MGLQIHKVMVDCVVDERVLYFFPGHRLRQAKQFSKLIIDQVFSSCESCRMLESQVSVERRHLLLRIALGKSLRDLSQLHGLNRIVLIFSWCARCSPLLLLHDFFSQASNALLFWIFKQFGFYFGSFEFIELIELLFYKSYHIIRMFGFYFWLSYFMFHFFLFTKHFQAHHSF